LGEIEGTFGLSYIVRMFVKEDRHDGKNKKELFIGARHKNAVT